MNSVFVFYLNFVDIIGVDFVVLILFYICGGFYGKMEGEIFGIWVIELIEVFNEDLEYFFDYEVGIVSVFLVEIEFVVMFDSIFYINYLDNNLLVELVEVDMVSFLYFCVLLFIVWVDFLISFYLVDMIVFNESNCFLECFLGFQLEFILFIVGMFVFMLQFIWVGVYIYYWDSIDFFCDYQLFFENDQFDLIV